MVWKLYLASRAVVDIFVVLSIRRLFRIFTRSPWCWRTLAPRICFIASSTTKRDLKGRRHPKFKQSSLSPKVLIAVPFVAYSWKLPLRKLWNGNIFGSTEISAFGSTKNDVPFVLSAMKKRCCYWVSSPTALTHDDCFRFPTYCKCKELWMFLPWNRNVCDSNTLLMCLMFWNCLWSFASTFH